MDKLKIITNFIAITFCVSVGISIGYNAQNGTIKHDKLEGNVITSTTENKAYNGKYNGSQIAFYDDIIKDIYNTKIYNTCELTTEILTNRNGKIIIEKVVGKVTNNNLDGKILNCNETQGNYICYKNVDGIKKNDTVLTYFIYNPLSNIEDDVLTRVDFIIDGNSI